MPNLRERTTLLAYACTRKQIGRMFEPQMPAWEVIFSFVCNLLLLHSNRSPHQESPQKGNEPEPERDVLLRFCNTFELAEWWC